MDVETITKVLRTVISVKFEKFVDPGIQEVCISYPVCNIRQGKWSGDAPHFPLLTGQVNELTHG